MTNKDPYRIGDEVFNIAIETLPDEKLPKENRGSWYCPCAKREHERIIRGLANQNNIDRIYDLGAGDLRLSTALSTDFDVIAYETNEDLVNLALDKQGHPDIEVRCRDYYSDWGTIEKQNAIFACIGRTNKLPAIASNGVSIEGVENPRIETAREGLSL